MPRKVKPAKRKGPTKRKKPGPQKGSGFWDPAFFAHIAELREQGVRSVGGAIENLLEKPEWKKHRPVMSELKSKVRTIQRGHQRWVKKRKPGAGAATPSWNIDDGEY
jgi:hypothetical protein